MELEEFVTKILINEQDPKDLKGMQKLENLGEVPVGATVFFVDRDVNTISTYFIEEGYQIKADKFEGLCVTKGLMRTGGYNAKNGSCGYIEEFEITETKGQVILVQERLNAGDVYLYNPMREMIEKVTSANK